MAAGGISLASFAGLDGNALVGAFAGAAYFVLRARDISVWFRVLYFGISLPTGYIGSVELMYWLPFRERGIAAFVAAATVLIIADRVLEWLDSASLIDIISRIRGGGK